MLEEDFPAEVVAWSLQSNRAAGGCARTPEWIRHLVGTDFAGLAAWTLQSTGDLAGPGQRDLIGFEGL